MKPSEQKLVKVGPPFRWSEPSPRFYVLADANGLIIGSVKENALGYTEAAFDGERIGAFESAVLARGAVENSAYATFGTMTDDGVVLLPQPADK